MSLVKVRLKNSDFPSHYSFTIIKNVVQILRGTFDEHEFVVDQSNAIHLELDSIDSESENIVAFIDNVYCDAFSHWFFESFIFIRELIALKSTYRHLKIFIPNEKKYMRDILNHFGLDITNSLNPDNLVIFFRRDTSLNLNHDSLSYQIRLTLFREFLRGNLPYVDRMVKTVFIPRQLTDNYSGNDRTLFTDDIEQCLSTTDDAIVIYTSAANSFKSQYSLVGRCDTLLVPDGSAFLVNGFIAHESLILVLGSQFVPTQSQKFDKMKLLLSIIRRHNDVIFINKNSDFSISDIEPFLNKNYISPIWSIRTHNAKFP